MKILVKEPQKDLYVKEISDNLFKSMNEINHMIGGYFEILPLSSKYIIIFNEESEHLNLPKNAYSRFGILHGTLIFAQRNSEDICNITDMDELIKLINEKMEFI